jgi:hypothetical protein
MYIGCAAMLLGLLFWSFKQGCTIQAAVADMRTCLLEVDNTTAEKKACRAHMTTDYKTMHKLMQQMSGLFLFIAGLRQEKACGLCQEIQVGCDCSTCTAAVAAAAVAAAGT